MVLRSFPKFYDRVIEEVKNSLHDEYYILVEFSFPRSGRRRGRQCDLLIMLENGFHLLELKNKPFTQILTNGDWILPNGSVSSNMVGDIEENPYEQAINTANSLKEWIKREVEQLPRSDKRFLESDEFQIFPSVVVRDFIGDRNNLIQHNWSYLVYDIESQIVKIFKRTWRNRNQPNNPPKISTTTIEKIIEDLRLVNHTGKGLDKTKSKPGVKNQTIPYLIRVLAVSENSLNSHELESEASTIYGKTMRRTFDNALNRAIKEGILLKGSDGRFRADPKVKKMFLEGLDPIEIYSNYSEFDNISQIHNSYPTIFKLYVEENIPEIDSASVMPSRVAISEEYGYYLKRHTLERILGKNVSHDIYIFRSVHPKWNDIDHFISLINYESIISSIIPDWDSKQEDLIIQGGAGTGKSVLAAYLGYKLINNGGQCFIFHHNQLSNEVIIELEDYINKSDNGLIAIILEDVHLAGRSYLEKIRKVVALLSNPNIQIIITTRSPKSKTLIFEDQDSSIEEETVQIDELILNKELTKQILGELLIILFQKLLKNKKIDVIRKVSQNVSSNSGYNFLFTKIILASALHSLDADYINGYQINLSKISEKNLTEQDQQMLFDMLNVSQVKITSLNDEFISSKLENIIDVIYDDMKIAKSVVRKTLISSWVLGLKEITIVPNHISQFWDIDINIVVDVLATLRQQGELVDEDAYYKLQHPIHGEIMLGLVQGLQLWNDIFYEFNSAYKIDDLEDKSFIGKYTSASSKFDPNFVIQTISSSDDEEEVQSISSWSDFVTFSQNLTCGVLIDLFWQFEDYLVLGIPSNSIWEEFDQYLLIEIILDEEEISVILSFLDLLANLDYSNFQTILDRIGIEIFADLILSDKRYPYHFLSKLDQWNWIQVPHLISRLFYQMIEIEDDQYFHVHELNDYPNFVDLIDANELLQFFDNKQDNMYRFSHILERFEELKLEVLIEGTKAGPEVYSLNLLSTLCYSFSRIDQESDRDIIISNVNNWLVSIIIRKLSDCTETDYWDFIHALEYVSEQKLSSILEEIPLETMKINYFSVDEFHIQFRYLKFLITHNYSKSHVLIEEMDVEEIIEFFFENEYYTLNSLKLLVDNEWNGIANLHSITPDKWIEYKQSFYYEKEILEILFVINYEEKDVIIKEFLYDQIKDRSHSLDEFIKKLEEKDYDWKRHLDLIILIDIINDAYTSDRDRILKFLEKHNWNYSNKIKERIEELNDVRSLENQRRNKEYETQQIENELNKIESSIKAEIEKYGGIEELGKAIYYLKMREAEEGIAYFRNFLSLNIDKALQTQLVLSLFTETSSNIKVLILNELDVDTCVHLLKVDRYFEQNNLLENLFKINEAHCIQIIITWHVREVNLRNPYSQQIYVNFFPLLEKFNVNYLQLELIFRLLIDHARFDLITRLKVEEHDLSKIICNYFPELKNIVITLNLEFKYWSNLFSLLNQSQAEELIEFLEEQNEYYKLFTIVKPRKYVNNNLKPGIIKKINKILLKLFTSPDVTLFETIDLKILLNILNYIRKDDAFLPKLIDKTEINMWVLLYERSDQSAQQVIRGFVNKYLPEFYDILTVNSDQ